MSWALDNLGPDRCRDIAASLFRVREEQCNGAWLRGHCPLPGHEDKNPSFGYDFANDKFKCLTPACNGYDGGDLIDLWSAINGHDKRAGFKAFKARFGQESYGTSGRRENRPAMAGSGNSEGGGNGKAEKPKRPARADEFIAEETWEALPELPEAWLRKLETQRAWSREVIQAQGLRLWRHAVSGEERVAIPVRDGQGRLRNIRKYLPGAGEGQKIKSWWEERAGEIVLFGEARLFPPAESWGPEPLWLCEGEPDCLCALSLGLNAATVTGGAGNWKPAWTETMAGRLVIIAYDADSAGHKGARKVAQRIAGAAAEVKIIAWPEYMLKAGELPKKGGQDLTDFIVKHGRTRADLEALEAEAEAVQPKDEDEDDGLPPDGPDSPVRFWLLGPGGRASFRPALLAAEILKENEFITDRESGITYAYNGRYYQPLVQADLQRLALTKLGDQATIPRVNDAVGQVVALSTLPMGEGLNNRPEFLCLPNGMLSLDTLDILPHAPSYRSTYMIPWKFDPNEPQDCPDFKAFLESTGNPVAVLNEIQEFAGYCLWPDCRYEKALFLVGVKGAGKSTLLEVLEWLVGEANYSAVDLEDLDKPHERAALHEKMLNVADEADSKFFSTKYFNTISSGKSLQAAFKYGHSFTFSPRCKLACSANDFPRAAGHTDAFLQRLLVVRFHRSFRGTAQQDTELAGKLRMELPGIFAWAIVGLNRLRERGRFPASKATQEAIREYRLDINNVLEFARDMLTNEPEADGMPPEVLKDDLYRAYSGWCKDNGYKPMGSALFFKRLKETGLYTWTSSRRTTPNGRQFYVEGIRLEVHKSL